MDNNKTSQTSLSHFAKESIELHLEQAQFYCDEGDWQKALETCQIIVDMAPTTAEIHKYFGHFFQRQGDTPSAITHYAKALELKPKFPEVYNNLGSFYAQQKQWDKAVTYFQKAIASNANFALAHWNLAKVWQQKDELDKALSCRLRALTLQPTLGSADDHYQMGQVLEASNRPSDALGCYRRAMAIDKNHTPSYERLTTLGTANDQYQIGQILEADSKPSDAIAAYRRAIEMDPHCMPAYQQLADLLETQGDWQDAVACYRQFLTLHALQANARIQNAQVDQSVNPVSVPLSDEEQRLLEQVLAEQTSHHQPAVEEQLPIPHPVEQSDPNSAGQSEYNQQNEHIFLAQQAIASEDWPQAIDYLKTALHHDPKSAQLHRQLAHAFTRNDQLEQATEAWYRTFCLKPEWGSAEQYVTLGNRLRHYENVKAAVDCYRAAIQQQPTFFSAYEQLAQTIFDLE